MIKNVNYGSTSRLHQYKDTTAQYIPVPCGRCASCLALKQQYLVQRVQMEALSHDLYMGTLTYNNESLPIYEINEFRFAYPSIADWQKMIKMIRKHEDLPPFKYMLVSEYGGKRHRPHFHFILSFPSIDGNNLAERWSFASKLHDVFLKYWRRNYGSTRSPVWKPLTTYVCTRRKRNFDLHYLDPWSSDNGLDDVAFYCSKYCLKYDTWVDRFKSKLFFNLQEDDYKEALKVFLPKRLLSKGFGSINDHKVLAHLNKGIDLALSDSQAMYPYFISPVDGSTFPLSPYYASKLLTFKDLDVFNSRKPLLTDGDTMVDTSKDDFLLQDVVNKELRMSNIKDWLNSQHTREDDDADYTNDFDIVQLNHEKISSLSADVFDYLDFESSAPEYTSGYSDA